MQSTKLIGLLSTAAGLKDSYSEEILLERARDLSASESHARIFEGIGVYSQILKGKPTLADALYGHLEACVRYSEECMKLSNVLIAATYADIALNGAENLWARLQSKEPSHILRKSASDAVQVQTWAREGLRRAFMQKVRIQAESGRVSDREALIQKALEHPAKPITGIDELHMLSELVLLYFKTKDDKLIKYCNKFNEAAKGCAPTPQLTLTQNLIKVFYGQESAPGAVFDKYKGDPRFVELSNLVNNRVQIGYKVEQIRKSDPDLAGILDRLCTPGHLPNAQAKHFVYACRKAGITPEKRKRIKSILTGMEKNFDPELYSMLRSETDGSVGWWCQRNSGVLTALSAIAAAGVIAFSSFFYFKNQSEKQVQQLEQRIVAVEKENKSLRQAPARPELERMRKENENYEKQLADAQKSVEEYKRALDAGGKSVKRLIEENDKLSKENSEYMRAETERVIKDLKTATENDSQRAKIKTLEEKLLDAQKREDEYKKQLADAQKLNNDYASGALYKSQQKQESNADIEKLAKERDGLKKKVEEIESNLHSVSLPAFAKGDPRSEEQKQRAAKLEEARGGLKKKVEELDGKLMNYDIQRLRQDNDALRKIQVDIARRNADLEKSGSAPQNPDIQKLTQERDVQLARIKNLEERLQKAYDVRGELSRSKTGSAELYYETFAKNYGMDVYERTKAELEGALKWDDSNAKAHYLLGNLEEDKKDFTAAAQHYIKAFTYGAEYRDKLSEFRLTRQDKIDEKARKAIDDALLGKPK